MVTRQDIIAVAAVKEVITIQLAATTQTSNLFRS